MDKFVPNKINFSKFAETIISDISRNNPQLVLNTKTTDFSSCFDPLIEALKFHQSKLLALCSHTKHTPREFANNCSAKLLGELPSLIAIAKGRVDKWKYRCLTAKKMVNYHQKHYLNYLKHSYSGAVAKMLNVNHTTTLIKQMNDCKNKLTEAEKSVRVMTDQWLENQLKTDEELLDVMSHQIDEMIAKCKVSYKIQAHAKSHHFSQMIKLRKLLSQKQATINAMLPKTIYVNSHGIIISSLKLSEPEKALMVAICFSAPDVVFWTNAPIKHSRVISIVPT